MANREITTLEEVRMLVDAFYGKVQKDDLLSGIFNAVIENRWPEHLEKMYRFWQTVLLDEHTYYGSPFPPHAGLPIGKLHFERWITLFYETIDEHFKGEKANEAKTRAAKMAEMFLYKIEYYRNNPAKHPF
ncbi:MAG: group III truncated hemoglobin [Bacteroidota bacterium]|nr:group III truncated hemoglobin [Bacteroidota bacterium]